MPSPLSWMVSEQLAELPVVQRVMLYPMTVTGLGMGMKPKRDFFWRLLRNCFLTLKREQQESRRSLLIATGSPPTAPGGTALGLN